MSKEMTLEEQVRKLIRMELLKTKEVINELRVLVKVLENVEVSFTSTIFERAETLWSDEERQNLFRAFEEFLAIKSVSHDRSKEAIISAISKFGGRST